MAQGFVRLEIYIRLKMAGGPYNYSYIFKYIIIGELIFSNFTFDHSLRRYCMLFQVIWVLESLACYTNLLKRNVSRNCCIICLFSIENSIVYIYFSEIHKFSHKLSRKSVNLLL